MVKALEAARKAARKALESTYHEGLCTIVEYRDVTDKETNLTRQQEIPVIENQPCKLSFENLSSTKETGTAAAIAEVTKLFLSPEIPVNGGSKIVVNWMGRETAYSCSGQPATYPTHTEVVLKLFRGWA